jgi:hypothetical protein
MPPITSNLPGALVTKISSCKKIERSQKRKNKKQKESVFKFIDYIMTWHNNAVSRYFYLYEGFLFLLKDVVQRKEIYKILFSYEII